MIVCPNCGASNHQGSRFCENCGADLRSLAAPEPPPQSSQPGQPAQPTFVPPPLAPLNPRDVPPTAPDWRMSGLPPEEPVPPRRRGWLWILLGIAAVILICCCGIAVWGSTGSEDGVNRFEHWATELADYATEQSGK